MLPSVISCNIFSSRWRYPNGQREFMKSRGTSKVNIYQLPWIHSAPLHIKGTDVPRHQCTMIVPALFVDYDNVPVIFNTNDKVYKAESSPDIKLAWRWGDSAGGGTFNSIFVDENVYVCVCVCVCVCVRVRVCVCRVVCMGGYLYRIWFCELYWKYGSIMQIMVWTHFFCE